jgi:hypothetical protein
MNLRFPLKDVTLREVSDIRMVEAPVYADDIWQMNQNEFAMQVEGVGSFFACNGNEVEYVPVPGSSKEALELYLNGSVYGAILHQRQILPLHGSSIIENNTGVIICGDSGAGKSSLAVAFCLEGSEFMTDDITPVIFKKGMPQILAMSDRIKLWDHSLEQLNLGKEGLKSISPGADKFYFPLESSKTESYPLKIIFILDLQIQSGTTFVEINGAEKVMAIRNEVYRPEYLKGMHANEPVFFHKIIEISREVKVFRISRPAHLKIKELMSTVRNLMIG